MSSLPSSTLAAVEPSEPAYQRVIDEICNLNWANLSDEDVIRVAWAYYHFLSAISGVSRNCARNVSRRSTIAAT